MRKPDSAWASGRTRKNQSQVENLHWPSRLLEASLPLSYSSRFLALDFWSISDREAYPAGPWVVLLFCKNAYLESFFSDETDNSSSDRQHAQAAGRPPCNAETLA